MQIENNKEEIVPGDDENTIVLSRDESLWNYNQTRFEELKSKVQENESKPGKQFIVVFVFLDSFLYSKNFSYYKTVNHGSYIELILLQGTRLKILKVEDSTLVAVPTSTVLDEEESLGKSVVAVEKKDKYLDDEVNETWKEQCCKLLKSINHTSSELDDSTIPKSLTIQQTVQEKLNIITLITGEDKRKAIFRIRQLSNEERRIVLITYFEILKLAKLLGKKLPGYHFFKVVEVMELLINKESSFCINFNYLLVNLHRKFLWQKNKELDYQSRNIKYLEKVTDTIVHVLGKSFSDKFQLAFTKLINREFAEEDLVPLLQWISFCLENKEDKALVIDILCLIERFECDDQFESEEKPYQDFFSILLSQFGKLTKNEILPLYSYAIKLSDSSKEFLSYSILFRLIVIYIKDMFFGNKDKDVQDLSKIISGLETKGLNKKQETPHSLQETFELLDFLSNSGFPVEVSGFIELLKIRLKFHLGYQKD